MSAQNWVNEHALLFITAAVGALAFGVWHGSVAAGVFAFCALAVLDQRST